MIRIMSVIFIMLLIIVLVMIFLFGVGLGFILDILLINWGFLGLNLYFGCRYLCNVFVNV